MFLVTDLVLCGPVIPAPLRDMFSQKVVCVGNLVLREQYCPL